MADEEDSLFNLDVVRDFIISKGGRSTNHELVTHFKFFLNDPKRKVANRQKFKEIVNTLAIVKLDENGEKVLQLKRKYREGTTGAAVLPSPSSDKGLPKNRPKAKKAKLAEQFESSMMSEAQSTPSKEPLDFSETGLGPSPPQEGASKDESGEPSLSDMIAGALGAIQGLSANSPTDDDNSMETAASEDTSPSYGGDSEEPEASTPSFTSPEDESPPLPVDPVGEVQVNRDRPETPQEVPEAPLDLVVEPLEAAAAEPLAVAEGYADSGIGDSSAPEDSIAGSVADSMDGVSMASSEGRGATGGAEGVVSPPVPSELEESVISVKQRAQHINRMESQSDLLSGPAQRRKVSKAAGASDDDASSEGSVAVTLSDVERKWLVDAAKADYHELAKALNSNPRLSRYKDFMSGYTALHWAAKHGNPHIVKLLCGSKEGTEVNSRSHGGYTPLHLASIQGHEEVIELLVQGYKADPDIRDYSGRKPKQYLKHSASSRSQQILQPRRIHANAVSSGAGGPTTFRRVGSYSSKIRSVAGAPFGIQGGVAMRTSWTDSRERGRTPSPSPSPQESPGLTRKNSQLSDQDVMPPPKGVPLRRHRSRRDERENLSDSETHTYNMPQPYRSGSDTDLVMESGV